MSEQEDFAQAVHYMFVLKKHYAIMQPEIRKAIDLSIAVLEAKS